MSPYTLSASTDEIVKSLVAVKLSIHRWSGNVSSRSLAKEIADSKKAEAKAVGTTIYYLPEDLRHEIGKAASALRSMWNTRTLPWQDQGMRICTADGYMDLMEDVSELKDAFMRVVDQFIIGKYDLWVSDARISLGDLFDPSFILPVDQLRDRFGVDFYSEPIVAAADVRIAGMSEAAVDLVKRSYEGQINAGVRGALQNIESQLRDVVSEYQARIEKDPANIKLGGLQKTVVRVCQGLRSVNITGDADLDLFLTNMEESLTKHTTSDIRGSEIKLKSARYLGESVASDLENIFGK